MYKLLRPLVFQFDPELVHDLLIKSGKLAGICAVHHVLDKIYHAEGETVQVCGLNFKNPIGLAAGFDKNCEIYPLLAALGFSHIEVGTVTPKPQPGNPKPRIFRYNQDQALINRMGFPSHGVEDLKKQIDKIQNYKPAILGINIGKNKDTSLQQAVDDYLHCYRELESYGDYFAINVSSPNTPELRKLQEKERLKELFLGIKSVAKQKKPIFIKLAPDLAEQELEEVIEVVSECSVDGLVLTNTTLSRDGLSVTTNEQGGLSGVPLKAKSLSFVEQVAKKTNHELPIIAAGGVFTATDVQDYLQAGARLVQVYTGLIFEGPGMVQKIVREIV